MRLLGGRAGFNSVSFNSDRYKSIAKLKRGKISAIAHVKRENTRITKLISQVPFIRSFTWIFELVIDQWKYFLFVMVGSIFLNVETDLIQLNLTFTNNLLTLLVALIIPTLLIKLTPIGRYHAAEHMCINAFDKELPIKLAYVKKQSRVHKDCGTNLIISFVITFIISFVVFGDALWVFLLSWAVAYEIWRNEPKILWSLVLILGSVAQYVLFTSPPNEKHLLVAIRAFEVLKQQEMLDSKQDT